MEDIFVGVDLHKRFFVYYGTNNHGEEIAKGKLDCTFSSVDKLVSIFSHPPKVVVEATGNWQWFVDGLKNKGCIVTLAHSFKTKAIASAKIKTDTVDAKTLCHLLRADLVPSAYIASSEEQENRELVRGRICLVRDQTQLKNRIIAILTKENLRFLGSDLFGTKGQLWLSEQRLSLMKRQIIEIYLKRLKDIQKSIKKVDTLIIERSGSLPEMQLLKSIPSIGTTTAFAIVSEVGRIERFPNSSKFSSYLGLVPRLSQSGAHAYYGRITKLGNPILRWYLVQAAYRYCRMDKEAKRFVDRISYKAGKKKAIVALSRKIAVIVYHVLAEKREYQKRKPYGLFRYYT